MLTIQYEADNILEIFCDGIGRDRLVELLGRLSLGDHDHLMTPSWGGYELSEEFPVAGLTPIHSVTISLVADPGDLPKA